MKDTTSPANHAETTQVKPKTETWWTIKHKAGSLKRAPLIWRKTFLEAQLDANYEGTHYEVVKVTVEPLSQEPQSKQPPTNDMRSQVLALRTEVNCRIEHGADLTGHLKYVQDRLDEILAPPAA